MTVPGFQLSTHGPFHLEATVRVLQRRPSNPVEVWHGDSYRRVLRVNGNPVLVEVTNRGTIEVPDVRFAILAGEADPPILAGLLRRILGLDVDPRPFLDRATRQPRLRSTARALRGMRPPRFPDLFEAIGNVVPFQQLSLDAGMAITTRLVTRFGQRFGGEDAICHTFPTAEVIAGARPKALLACGFSNRKVDTLRRLAGLIAAGDLDEQRIAQLSTPEALRVLTALPGIGPWSAGVLLLRGFGRLEVFPPGDAGASRGLGKLLQRDGPGLERIIQRFGPLRGYLYFCALGDSLLAKGYIHPAPPPIR